MKTRAAACLFLCLILTVAQAQASTPEFFGTFTVREILFDGQTHVTADAVAIFGNYTGVPSSVAWTSGPTDVLVNWTRVGGTSYGFVPGNPDAGITYVKDSWDSQQASHTNVTLRATPMNPDAKILLVGAIALEGTLPSAHAYAGQEGVNWSLGMFSNPLSASSTQTPIPRHQYSPPAEAPVVEADGAARLATQGNVTAYLWGFEITIEDAGQPVVYKSGTWTENPTPATGPARATQQRHHQLLRITMDAATELQQSGGSIHLAAHTASGSTNGTVLLREASGILEGAHTAYPVNKQDVKLGGSTRIVLASDAVGGALATQVQTAQPLAGVFAVPKTVATPKSPSWVLVPIVGLLVIIVVGGYVWWRREEPLRAFGAAERMATMVRTDPEKAERKIRSHLQRHPHDTDFVILQAQTYLELGRNRELLREFDKYLGRGGRQVPVLAMIMAKASARLKRKSRTLSLVTAASLDPIVREEVARDNELAPFLHQLQRPPPRPDTGNIAYA